MDADDHCRANSPGGYCAFCAEYRAVKKNCHFYFILIMISCTLMVFSGMDSWKMFLFFTPFMEFYKHVRKEMKMRPKSVLHGISRVLEG